MLQNLYGTPIWSVLLLSYCIISVFSPFVGTQKPVRLFSLRGIKCVVVSAILEFS